MESEINELASSINDLIGSSIRRAMGQGGNPIETGYIDGLITAFFLTGKLDVDGFAVFDLFKAFRQYLPVAGCDLELDGFPVMCPSCGHKGVRTELEPVYVTPIVLKGVCPRCGFSAYYELQCGDSCKI